jgi:hypothetical protein
MSTGKDKEVRATFAAHGLAEVPADLGSIINARYVMSYDDWYVQTRDENWYWYDARTKQWKHCPTGPLC